MNIRPYSTLLRSRGFVKDFDSRAGGVRAVCFSKTVGNRMLAVQLWGDGAHRVSHYLDGRMTTIPTGFTDTLGMLNAIQKELTRTDQGR